MTTEPLIAMLGILIALGLTMAIYLAAYRYYKAHGSQHPGDR